MPHERRLEKTSEDVMTPSDPIAIVGAKRTAMGGFQGELSPVKAPELGAAALDDPEL